MKNKTNLEDLIDALESIDSDQSEESRMLHRFAKQHGGVILTNVDLSAAYGAGIDKQINIHGLRLDSTLRSDGVYSLESVEEGHQKYFRMTQQERGMQMD